MGKIKINKPTEGELEILGVLWEKGEVTVSVVSSAPGAPAPVQGGVFTPGPQYAVLGAYIIEYEVEIACCGIIEKDTISARTHPQLQTARRNQGLPADALVPSPVHNP